VANDAVAEFKQASWTPWAASEWDEISTLIAEVAPRLLDHAGVEPGMTVLDVVTAGTGGSVAIEAARRGARVVGCDFGPELLDYARRCADEAGVEIDLVVGDPESLPFADGTFDRVLSSFGHMYSPRHALAGAELARVCRTGGIVATATWTSDGAIGAMFDVFERHLPPRPGFAEPPVLWGSEDHVRRLFEGLELEFERATLTFRQPSVGGLVTIYEDKFGPTVRVKEQLGERWPALRSELADIFEWWNHAEDGSLAMEAPYLITIGSKQGPAR
jgi:SAM-dependent methyltransferase